MQNRLKAEALDLLAEAEGFANTHLPAPRAQAQNTIKRVVHFCQQYTSVAADVLPSHMHRSIADAVTDRVFAEVVNAVLRLTDIDQHARLSELLMDLTPLAADSEANVPCLARLQKLVVLLDARLVNIPIMHANGELKTFTNAELRGLVLALFSDSPLRRDCLQKLSG